MLRAGSTSNVKFKVDVHGTGAEPKVRVVLALPDGELGFPATKNGDSWETKITVPKEVPAGNYAFRVEVTVNNRLFTPLKKDVEIAGAEEKNPAPAPTPVPPVEIPKPVQTEAKKIKKVALQEVKAPAKKPTKNLLDIANEVEKRERKPAKPIKESVKQQKTTIKPATPVTLKKGAIVYE